ncbi:MAG: hypothetical protein HZA60_05940 [Deltaproteobacteria bacterium]|nr:hypothetical protein [Deltaproteobacteria bacterium]
MDRKKVEQFRLALFGRMVMGVSHEVDNYLSVILGFAELIQIEGGARNKTLDGAGKILNAGEKINTIIRHFSHYVRPHAPLHEPFSPAEMVADCLVFSKYDLGRHNVNLAPPESYPARLLTADRRDLALALLALLFNGAEAMASSGGTLRLDVSLTNSGWEFIVADEGPGIPPDIAPSIFEEGFTTKSGIDHAGMGLPVARYLVSEAGGVLAVETRLGGGCSATVRLPARQ